MISLDYAYLPAILLSLPVWLFLYFKRNDVHRKMIRLSLYGAIAGPISQLWYVQDYWHPIYTLGRFGIVEDMLFAAFVAGISGGVINLLLGVRSVESKELGNSWMRIVVAIALIIGALFLMTNVLKIDSIYASAISFVLLSGLILYQRPDLWKASLVGMIFWLCAIIPAYNVILLIWPRFIEDWWLWSNISGITLLNIPLEEYLWFGTWGLVGSIIYEWKGGYRFIPDGAKEPSVQNHGEQVDYTV